ncbi:hypothetical protein EYV94_21600 [Puteibacter caeruleilacunae]|nr:hypothetical protein EYV94_21600 [Puteibacter caeruleilacunae]
MYCKLTLLCVVLMISGIARAQNLINPSSWTVGNSIVPGFKNNGPVEENRRVWGETPLGTQGLLWEAAPDAGFDCDGGWETSWFPVDHTKMYRFVVWIKKTKSVGGLTYLGCYGDPGHVLSLDGVTETNPYFWYGDLPQLEKWFLLVGYVHGSGDPSTTSYGGIYDGVTGEKVVDATDFKFTVGATQAAHRTYLYYDCNTNDRQYFYAPRVDEVNGNEPSIASLLGMIPSSNISGNLIVDGQVGVNTNKLEDFHVSVNGKLRAKEVRVATDWADFVFDENYQLMSIEEVAQFIEKRGHLPNIPKASVVEEDGISVGEMNKLLLQKIEELTLYMIEHKKTSDAQADELKELKEQNKQLRMEISTLSKQLIIKR